MLDPFAVNPIRRTALQPSADSEGIAIERDGTVLVSTEAHAAQGQRTIHPRGGSRSRGVSWARPSPATRGRLDRVLDNKGFEALTLASGRALGLDDETYVVTAPEYALSGDDSTHHDVYAWPLDEGSLTNPPLPSNTMSYTASSLDGTPLGVVEFEAPLRLSIGAGTDLSDDEHHKTVRGRTCRRCLRQKNC